jgi:hypothetical protein
LATEYDHTQILLSKDHILGVTPAVMQKTLTDPTDETFFLANFDPGFNGTIIDMEYNLSAVLSNGSFDAPLNYAGTVVDDASVGTIVWSNPTNAQEIDTGTYAAATMLVAEVSHYLKATDFGFSIPSGATILGIQANIYANDTATGVVDSSVKIVKGGVISGDEKADTITSWPTATWKTTPWGGSTDLWGLSWTPTDINASNFGIAVSATPAGGNSEARIYAFRITIFYSIPILAEWIINPQRIAEEVLVSETLVWETGGNVPNTALEGFKKAANFTNAKTPFTIKLALTWASGEHTITTSITDTENTIRVLGISE